MIFVTIGSMFPFDRLVGAMDAWAARHPGEEIFAQIGAGSPPARMEWARKLEREDYACRVARAELIIAHAGMGSVITAGEFGKPIVLLPRRAALGEHTNDHQVDTAGWLRTRPGIAVADTEADLEASIAAARAGEGASAPSIGAAAPADFLARLRAFALG